MRERVPIILSILVFASLSIVCAVTSEGFLEADGCTHYMYARWAFEYPVYFVDIWGRPFKTALYAPAAATLGLIGVRLTSLAVAIAIAFIAYAIARGQQYRWPALAVIFTFAQPILFLHSFSELTELPFAMLLGGAFLAYQRRQWWALTVLAGLLPLSRPEGFGFVALAAILLAAHRKWLWLPILAAPVMAWQIAGAMLYREPGDWWRWLAKHWPYAGDSLYAAGPIWHFVALLPAVVGPLVFPFVLLGIQARRHGGTKARSERAGREALSSRAYVPTCLHAFFANHRYRCDVLIAAIPLMILVGHSVLYWLGKMASNGEVRYMLIVAPFWALLACRGWGWVWNALFPRPGERRGWRSPCFWAGVMALLPIFANRAYKVLPLVQTEDWKTAARIAEWYKTSGVAKDYPQVMVSHPGVVYALDWSLLDPRLREFNRENVAACPDGTVLIWDAIYGEHNADRRKSVRSSEIGASWIPDSATLDRLVPRKRIPGRNGLDIRHWAIYISDRAVDGSPTPTKSSEHEPWLQF